MDKSEFAIIAACILLFSFVSGRLRNTSLTAPMVFAAFGFVVGAGVLNYMSLDVTHGAVHLLAEVTLVLVLFSDAARIDLRALIRDHSLPVRMLAIGMPMTIAAGTLVALALPLEFDLVHAALLAAVLAPTDAALGQSVVSNPAVPVRVRQALNVESGLNDGIAVPVVVLLATLALADASEASDYSTFLAFGALQVTLGPLAGLLIGTIGGRLMDRTAARGWMSMAFEGPAVLALAGLAFACSELIGGNGFIAAFVAGLCFGYVIGGKCGFILEFAESEGQLLTLAAFMVFGAVMLPEVLHGLSWAHVIYAVLSLTVIRMFPVALSLMGSGINPTTTMFLGWFGPRGLASILFALLIVERLGTPQAQSIMQITILTIALSIVLHGITAAPVAAWYGRMTKARGDCPENEPVSEMPARTGHVGSTPNEETV